MAPSGLVLVWVLGCGPQLWEKLDLGVRAAKTTIAIRIKN